MSDWFTANRKGLRQIGERLVVRRGFGIIGSELYQNVMDTNATTCDIKITKIEGSHAAAVSVVDNDPEGFPDLSHAWTLFAPSLKKSDPTKAGRFNMGEKFVLSFCRAATIHTTKGTVIFNDEGRKDYPRRKREVGTSFEAVIDCTEERMEQFLDSMNRIIVRPGLTLTVNGNVIPHRKALATFNESLATEISNDEGDLRPTIRKCDVEIYEVMPGETAMLYELGIPVVETEDKWHYNVKQKVPLNVDRDNVTPAFLRTLRTYVANHMASHLEESDVNSTWVREATSDDRISLEAMTKALDLRFGEKRVAFDPNDPEANRTAVANGFTVVSGSMLNKDEWVNVRKTGTTTGAGQVFPSPKPYSAGGDMAEFIPESEWTPGMKKVGDYAKFLHEKIFGASLQVRILKGSQAMGDNTIACYCRGQLDFCLKRLGYKWFNDFGGKNHENLDELLIHEFGHWYSGNHLDHEYYDGLCKVGSKFGKMCMDFPEKIKALRG